MRRSSPCRVASLLACACWLGCSPVTFERVLGAPYFSPSASDGRQTADGGYVLTGVSGVDADGQELLVVRADPSGGPLWIWSKPTSTHGAMASIVETDDHRFIGCGAREVGPSQTRFGYAVGLTANGDLDWEAEVGAPRTGACYGVRATFDGHFALFASLDYPDKPGSALYLEKRAADGTVLWSRSYSDDRALDLAPTPDGGYLLLSDDYEPGFDTQVVLRKLDANGDLVWRRSYGEPGWNESPRAMTRSADGSVSITGTSTVQGGSVYEGLALRIDALGDQLWHHELVPWSRAGLGVADTSDGGLLFTGVLPGIGDSSLALLVRTDGLGNVVWERTFGDVALGVQSLGKAVAQTSDGGAMLAGWGYLASQYGMLLVKTDGQGLVGS